MANQEKDLGHTKFICLTNSTPGVPHGMRFDPGIFSDSAITMMLRSQIDFVVREQGALKITTYDSADKKEETNLKRSDVLEEKDREDSIGRLFQQIRGVDIVKVLIVRHRPVPQESPSPFEEFINTLPADRPTDKI